MDSTEVAILPVALNVIGLLFLSGVFSGAETAFTNLSPARIEVIKNDGKFASNLMYRLYQKLDMVISLSLIMSNGVNIFLATYLTIFFTTVFGIELGGTLSASVGTVLVIIFGEILPKKIAILYPIHFSRATAHLLELLRILTFPLLLPIQLINKGMDTMKPLNEDQERVLLEEEIHATLGIGHLQGALESKEYEMMKQLLLLNDREVKEIMTARSEITAIHADSPVKDLLLLSADKNVSRVPVFTESIDTIDYIIHTIQLAPFLTDPKNLDRPVIDFCSTPAFKIPETKILDDLFFEFQRKRLHMAIVLDEYGNTNGLITLEDIVEEIFGEIEDETDELEIIIERIDDITFRAEGDATLEQIEPLLNLEFPEEFPKHKTIGWLILNIIHRFPEEGEKIRVPETNLELEVVDKDEEYIDKVHITILEDTIEPEETPTE